MNIRMLGSLRRIVDEEELSFAGEAEVDEAIEKLVERHRPEFQRQLSDPHPQNIAQSALIMLNGVEINNLNGLRTRLSDDDKLVIIPVAHGG